MTLRNRGTSSRRDLLSLGAASAMGLMSSPGVAFGAERDRGTSHDSLSVRTFGAMGDALSMPRTHPEAEQYMRRQDAICSKGRSQSPME